MDGRDTDPHASGKSLLAGGSSHKNLLVKLQTSLDAIMQWTETNGGSDVKSYDLLVNSIANRKQT